MGEPSFRDDQVIVRNRVRSLSYYRYQIACAGEVAFLAATWPLWRQALHKV